MERISLSNKELEREYNRIAWLSRMNDYSNLDEKKKMKDLANDDYYLTLNCLSDELKEKMRVADVIDEFELVYHNFALFVLTDTDGNEYCEFEESKEFGTQIRVLEKVYIIFDEKKQNDWVNTLFEKATTPECWSDWQRL